MFAFYIGSPITDGCDTNLSICPVKLWVRNISILLVGIFELKISACVLSSEGSKSSTHYLSDTNRFDVSSKGSSSGISLETSNLFVSLR